MAKRPSSSSKSSGSTSQPASNMKPWLRQTLIHLGILLGFYVITVAYFNPLVFENKVVNQSDILHYKGMAKETQDFRAETGEEALWVSTLFSGMPAFQTSIKHFGDLMWDVNKFLWFGLPRPANYIFMMFAGFFFLLRVLKVNPWLSGVGAAAFALSSYFFIISEVGHTSKANAIAYMAPVLASIMLTYQGRILLGASLTALFTALEVNANHYQITYYLIIVIGLFAIAYFISAIQNKQLPDFFKASAVLIVAGLLGVGPNLGKILTTSQYAEFTMRGKSELKSQEARGADDGLEIDYAFRWSYGVSESLTLLVPNLYGGVSGAAVDRDSELYKFARRANNQQLTQMMNRFPVYWGPQPSTSGPVYVGAIVCFLFILGLILVEGPVRWWLLAATILSLFLSWGNNFMAFNEFMFNYFPLYNKFRAPSMTLVIAGLAMPLLGILGLQRLIQADASEKAKMERALYISAGITGGIALILALGGSSLLSFIREGEEQYGEQLLDMIVEYRAGLLKADAFRSFAFIAGAAGAIFLYMRGNLKAVALYGILAALVVIDMLPVASRYLNEENYVTERQYDASFQPSAADNFILQDTDPNFRVLNLTVSTFNDATTSYHHKSIGGYHAAKLRRYADIIERYISTEMNSLIGVLRQQATPEAVEGALSSSRVLNMLNTRYIIINPQGRPLQNPNAYGNAWFVQNLQRVNNPDEEIASLTSIDPRTTAVVDVNYEGGVFGKQVEGMSLNVDSTARIVETGWSPKELTYQSVSQQQGVVLFSEIYYDGEGRGWNAYIDGELVPHFRANYVLRGLKVPAGQHEITFKFEPEAYETGNQIGLVASIIVLLLTVVALGLSIRTWIQGETKAEETA